MVTFANGRIPLAFLVQAANGAPGQVLEPQTAAQWAAMVHAAQSESGLALRPQADGDVPSCYRDIAGQERAAEEEAAGGPEAAPVGGSNHGLGKAIDIEMDPGVFAWLSANAERFGFDNVQGKASGESWHWVCTRVVANITSVLEDDMPDMNTFLNTAAYSGGPSISQVLKDLADAAPHAEAALVVQCKERGIWLIGPGYKHHMTPEESGQVAVAKYRTVDFGAATRAFDVFVAAHTQPTA